MAVKERPLVEPKANGNMSQPINDARLELEAAQSALEAALRAWDESVSELWRTSLALTRAQKRVTRAHELLRNALNTTDDEKPDEEHRS
jgi:exonuclease VII small subunit